MRTARVPVSAQNYNSLQKTLSSFSVDYFRHLAKKKNEKDAQLSRLINRLSSELNNNGNISSTLGDMRNVQSEIQKIDKKWNNFDDDYSGMKGHLDTLNKAWVDVEYSLPTTLSNVTEAAAEVVGWILDTIR